MRPSGDALVADGGFLSRGKVLEVPDSLDTKTQKKEKLLFISRNWKTISNPVKKKLRVLFKCISLLWHDVGLN